MKFAALIVASLAVACCASPFGDFFDRLDDFRGKIHDRIVDDMKKFSDRLNLDQSIRERFQDMHDRIDEFAKNSTAIRNCFESEFNGFDFNIFNSSLDFATISSVYYSAFPEKEMDDTSIQTLIESVRDIFEKCLSGRFGQARFGFTSLSDMTDDQISAMNGAIPGDRFNASQSENRFARAASGKDAVCHRDGNLPSSFDWRQHGVVTPVRNQGGCGSCWTFATTASMESAYLIHKKTNNQNFDLSEQQLVDCSKSDGCKGGFAYTAMGYIQRNGQTSEQNWPYRGNDNRCPGGKQAAAQLPNFCVRSIYYYGEGLQTENLSDDDIRKALVFFGPLYITFNASPIGSRNYRGGVFSDPNCPKQINHAVTLVGYTPDAWIIKNSWGGGWGEQGYFHMARGSNMCGINTEIAYPLIN